MPEHREYSLDVLKIVATILIVFHHYQQVTGLFFQDGLNFCSGKFYFGYIVELFFVLSGYFMYKYIDRIKNGLSFARFYIKHALRFMPMVAICAVGYECVLGVYVILFHGPYTRQGTAWPSIWGTVIDILGIQHGWVLPDPYVNSPTWYISVLLLCYILFYLSVYLSQRTKTPLLYWHIFIILMGLGIQTFQINLPFMTYYSARGYYAFFFGLLLAGFLKNHSVGRKGFVVCCFVLVAIPLLICYANSIIGEVAYVMTFVYYPALIMVFKSAPFVKIFDHKWIGTLGAISFDVYLWHSSLYMFLYIVPQILHIDVTITSLKAMLLFTLIAFSVGTVSYYCLELPIKRRVDKALAKTDMFSSVTPSRPL